MAVRILRVASAYFGIVGDGKAYETKGVANLLDAFSSADRIELQDAPVMLLGETFELSQLRGKVLTTSRPPNPDARGTSPWFLWDGPRGGRMLSLDRCVECVIDGFVFETDDRAKARQPAGVAIDVDGGADTKGSGQGGSCTFARLRHVSNLPEIDTTFLSIAATTKANQEFHQVVECGGNGNGRGTFLYQGPSPNAKNTVLRDTRYCDRYQYGVRMLNGSIHLAERNNFSFNTWNLSLEGATGYCTEKASITEASQHHAYYNVPIESVGNQWDASQAADGYITIGPGCADVHLHRSSINRPPAGARLFAFTNDASQRRVELGPFGLEWGFTLAQLGLDDDSLELQRGEVLFHDRGHFADNPNAPGVQDLPSGELHFNVRDATVKYTGDLETRTPRVSSLLKGPVPWETLPPGTSSDYIDMKSGYVRRQMCFPDGSYAEMPVGAYKKVKP